MQHALYRAAKADPNRRFHALRDKVYREDVLWRAWVAVRRNNGAPGIDKTTLADVEDYGVSRLLGELADELRAGTWRPLPARKVLIPKPGSTECRPLAIAAVRDRIVQAAVKIVLEPVFEADFLACSFGFRPKRSAHDALQVLVDESWQGRRWVVETGIANCFSAIPHEELMRAVEERISDQGVLKLVRVMLRAGVMEGGQVRREVTGAAQGGPASPLLCNIYLHRPDRAREAGEHGVLVRYCVLCRRRHNVHRARNVLAKVPAAMQAEVKDAYWALSGTEDLTTEPGPRLVELIDHRITEMAARYSATYPAAMKCLLADREGLTAYLRFPAEHHHRIRHSNFIERTFGETRRRTKVIGRLPGETSCLSLVWAVLDRASRGWRGLTITADGLRLL